MTDVASLELAGRAGWHSRREHLSMTDNRQHRWRGRGLARHMRPGLAGLAVLALTLAPACGDDDSGDGDAAASTTTADDATSAPTTAPPTPEEEAEAVYLELVDVVYRLLTTDPDPDDPDLARLAVDPALGNFKDSLSTMKAENQIVERGDATSQEVLSTSVEDASTVVLRVCSQGNDRRIDRDDGSVVSDGSSTRLLESVVVHDGDTWRVSTIRTQEVFEGLVECPA
jgi:hypothetical protein